MNKFVSLAIMPVILAAMITSALSRTEDEQNTIAVYQAVMPSVVTVLVHGFSIAQTGAVKEVNVTGSGFAVEPGIVITNYHVIENARQISVILHDGRQQAASLIGTAPGFDLAVLHVPFGPEELPAARLASAVDLQVGQKVVTISSPLGLHHSITAGVISSLHRELPGLELGANFIQFDAPLNPGQSGGPLVDSDGRVIGITTAKIDVAEDIGFAIPVDVIINILPDLKAMGHPFRPQIGFSGTTINRNLAILFDLPANHGVLVESVEEGSLAHRAGLRGGSRFVTLGGRDYVLGGDILLAVDGLKIRGTGDLLLHLLAMKPGQILRFKVENGISPREVQFELAPMIHGR